MIFLFFFVIFLFFWELRDAARGIRLCVMALEMAVPPSLPAQGVVHGGLGGGPAL